MANDLADVWTLIGAARMAQEPAVRVLYAARARMAIEAAGQELDVLRVNLKGIEDTLPKGTELKP